jgi:hypothetical protein
MLIQNPRYSPYVHFKSTLLYGWCMFIEFHPLINIFIQVGNQQFDDFTMCLWHLNKVHFVESP